MSSRDYPSKTEGELLDIKRGAETVLVGGKTLSLLGATLDQTGLLQATAGHLSPYVTVRDMRAGLEQGVTDRRAKAPETKAFILAVKQAVTAVYGEHSVEFSQFGFKAEKTPIELTPEQKKLKVDRARATRAKRGTLGSRQKRSVKGVVNPEGGNAGSPAAPPQGNTTAPGPGSSNAKP